jgi:hypothetical protein
MRSPWLGRLEAGGGQHRADAAIAALDQAVRLGMTGLDQDDGA